MDLAPSHLLPSVLLLVSGAALAAEVKIVAKDTVAEGGAAWT